MALYRSPEKQCNNIEQTKYLGVGGSPIDCNLLVRFGRGLSKDYICQVILNYDHWFWRRTFLKYIDI